MSYTDTLWVCVPGITPPAPRPRARISVFGGRQVANIYTPSSGTYGKWKAAAVPYLALAQRAFPVPGLFPCSDAALEVRMLFVAPMPISNARKRKPTLRQWCRSLLRGDADNVAKGPMDAGNKILWRDDRDVARLVVEHVVGEQGEPARLEMMVRRLPPRDSCRTEFEEIRARLRARGELHGHPMAEELSWEPYWPESSLDSGGVGQHIQQGPTGPNEGEG